MHTDGREVLSPPEFFPCKWLFKKKINNKLINNYFKNKLLVVQGIFHFLPYERR